VELVRDSTGFDRDGDVWNALQFVAKDKDGMAVKLLLVMFRSKTVIITIGYGNVQYRYQGRPAEFTEHKKETSI
jgi:hypothetical protein